MSEDFETDWMIAKKEGHFAGWKLKKYTKYRSKKGITIIPILKFDPKEMLKESGLWKKVKNEKEVENDQ